MRVMIVIPVLLATLGLTLVSIASYRRRPLGVLYGFGLVLFLVGAYTYIIQP